MQSLPFSAPAVRKGVFFTRQFVIVSPPGGGKTTLSDGIANSFGLPPLMQKSAGAFMRDRARQCGFGERIHEFARHMREHPDEGHDQWCDEQVAALGRMNNLVLDCHLPPFAPYGFSILLVCDLAVRAKRRAPKHPDKTVEQVAEDLRQRGEDDEAKYHVMYPGSLWPNDDYHLVLDTQEHNAEQCLAITLETHRKWTVENHRNLITGDVLSPELVSER